MQTEFCRDADELVSAIPDGASIAIFKDSGVPMEAARALVRRGVKGLHLITVPTGQLVADLLIGAGCISTVETSGISLGELGPAPNFIRAVRSGEIKIKDATCPAIYSQLQAAEKGIPFMPIRGLIGTDLLAHRPDFKLINNPFDDRDKVVALPALRPDFAIVHVALADRSGNAWVGRQPELKMMAHAARCTLVTAEQITDDNILEEERLAAACLPALYVNAVAPAPEGAWPLAMPGHYDTDADHLKVYCERAREMDGMVSYIEEFVTGSSEAAE